MLLGVSMEVSEGWRMVSALSGEDLSAVRVGSGQSAGAWREEKQVPLVLFCAGMSLLYLQGSVIFHCS